MTDNLPRPKVIEYIDRALKRIAGMLLEVLLSAWTRGLLVKLTIKKYAISRIN
jgi:hypothetical protein